MLRHAHPQALQQVHLGVMALTSLLLGAVVPRHWARCKSINKRAKVREWAPQNREEFSNPSAMEVANELRALLLFVAETHRT